MSRTDALSSRLAPARDRAQTWFAGRSQRERWMLTGLAIVAVIALLVIAIWRPLVAVREDAKADIARNAAAIARVRAVEDQLGEPSGASSVPPTTAVTESSAGFGLTIRRLEPDGQQIRVVLGDAPFEQVIQWLNVLKTDYALNVVSAEMDRRTEPGIVSADITLER